MMGTHTWFSQTHTVPTNGDAHGIVPALCAYSTSWALHRHTAVSTCSFCTSIPMAVRPVDNAATSVEPLPQNGSNTFPPAGTISTTFSISGTGFDVG